MSQANWMTAVDRRDIYTRGTRLRLTPRQLRRLQHKLNRHGA